MAQKLRYLVQRGLHRAGLHIEQIRNPFNDQKVLLGMGGANTILDCGANVGQTALSYHKLYPTAKIYSFRAFHYALRPSRAKYCGDCQY